jgi:protein TonB
VITPARCICLIVSIGIHALLFRTGRWISSAARIELTPGFSAVELTLLPSVASIAREPEPLPVEEELTELIRPKPVEEPTAKEPPAEERPVAEPLAEKPSVEAADNNANIKEKGVESFARPEVSCTPVYPRVSRRRGEKGTVVVSLTVTTDGKAEQVAIMQSSGYSLLDQAALNAVRKSRFKPAMRNGKAIDSSLELPFDFKLTDK